MAAVAGVLATLGLDYVLRLDRAQRVFIMVVAYAGLAYVLWKVLVAPLRVPMSGDDLALLVERRHRALGDRLISSLQFERRRDPAVSDAMIRAAADQANAMAASTPFHDVVERGRLWRTLRLAACSAALLAGFGIWQGGVLGLWAKRHLLLMSDADAAWPQDTYLDVLGAQNGTFSVLRGDDLKVVIMARGEVAPQSITLFARFPSLAGQVEETLEIDASTRCYQKVFPSVAEEFEFYVMGGDDRRGKKNPLKVRLIDAPSLIEARYTIIAPPYMNRRDAEVEASRGSMAVPVNSRIDFVGTATKDIRAARLLLDGQPVAQAQVLELTVEGTSRRRLVKGSLVLSGANVPASRTLSVWLQDSEGFTNRRAGSCAITVQSDAPPTVEAKRHGVSERIAPTAIVPLALDIKDEYGLSSAWVSVRCHGRSAALPDVPVANLSAGAREFRTPRQEADLEPARLKPGDVVVLCVHAADSMPRELGGPNIGSGATIELRVIKPEELKDELIQRQKALRAEFIQAIALQESSRAKTAAAAEAIGEDLPPELASMLVDSSRMQATVASQTAHVADAMAAIREELSNNRLANQEDLAQVQSVVDPLRALGTPMAQASALLSGARQINSAPEARKQVAEIALVQAAIARQMDEVLQRMLKLESRQELANQLETLIKWSEGLRDQIEKIGEREVGNVFLPPATSRPATRPAGEP
jgi:DNA-binding transcriptional MerR regulator